MKNDYILLTEKDEIWARMLMEVLKDTGIPYTSRSVYGAALVIRGGAQERLQIYVPVQYIGRASELVEELFSSEAVIADEYMPDGGENDY